jgi:hypothetical protein
MREKGKEKDLYGCDTLTSHITGRKQIEGVSAKGADENFKNHDGKGCNRFQWRTLVNTVINLRVPGTAGNLLIEQRLLASQGSLCYKVLVNEISQYCRT